MGELYCCSNQQRARALSDSHNKTIGKADFSKKYIIGSGGFSKVSQNIYYIIIFYIIIRFGKLNLKKITKYMQ